MHYSDKENSVRVDFFKPSGKWYTTEAVEWLTYAGTEETVKVTRELRRLLIGDAFREALVKHLTDPRTGRIRLAGMLAVCLDPYHEHAHPQMMTVPEKA